MSIRRRIEAMEREAGGSDPLIVFFKTFLEEKDGGTASEVWSASIVTGPNSGTFLQREDDQTFEDFQARAYAVSQGVLGADEKADTPLKQAPLSPTICMNKPGSKA